MEFVLRADASSLYLDLVVYTYVEISEKILLPLYRGVLKLK